MRERALSDSALREAARAWGFWMLVADRDYSYRSRLVDEIGLDPECPALTIAATGRYFELEAVLNAFGRCFDRVFLSDTRDAYFQADPFQYLLPSGGFYSFQEQVRRGSACCTLQGNPVTSRWQNQISEFLRLEQPLNEDMRKTVSSGANTPIICSGVSGGATASVMAWLRAFLGLLIRMGRAPVRHEGANPFDQGVHNYLIYKRLFPGNITIPTNEEGPVFHNVCWEPQWKHAAPSAFRGINAAPEHLTDPVGQLMNGKRTMVASLVHQYDRCAHLARRVHAHFNRP